MDVEMRYMNLERFVHELSAVVAAQQKAIDALTIEARRLRERVTDDGVATSDDKPPHY